MKSMNSILLLSIFMIIPIDSNAGLFKSLRVVGRMPASSSLAARMNPVCSAMRSSHSHSRSDDARIKAHEIAANADEFLSLRQRHSALDAQVMTAIRSGGPSLMPHDYERNPQFKNPLVKAFDDVSRVAVSLKTLYKEANELAQKSLDVDTKKELESFIASLAFQCNSALNLRNNISQLPQFEGAVKIYELQRIATALEKIAVR